MASTTVQTNNKLIQFRRQICREYIRENLFSPYMGSAVNSIIRSFTDPKKGGEQINIPLIARLKNQAVATGTLVGNEETIDNYGMRMWIDWARNAVKISNAEEQKSSVDLFAEAKPLLSDWGKELQRDEIIDGLYAIPSESSPAGLGTSFGQRVNGIYMDAAAVTDRNSWTVNNTDRVLFGDLKSNNTGVFAASCANIAVSKTLSANVILMIKRIAKRANPRIRPYKLSNGREYFVLFVGQEAFRDCAKDVTIVNANTQARAREGDGINKNPLFQDGDLLYNGVIIREIPEMSVRLPVFYSTAGTGGIPIAPCFLCGQMAAALVYGRMPMPTFLKEDDYQFFRGSGIKMAYGVGKIVKKDPAGLLKEWGIATAFVAAAPDS
jgi:hypothetical protein